MARRGSVSEGMKKKLAGHGFEGLVEEMVQKLKRRELTGSGTTAEKAAELLLTVISKGRFSNAYDLLATIKFIGKKISAANPIELSIGNIVRRILHIIRQELVTYQKAMQKQTSTLSTTTTSATTQTKEGQNSKQAASPTPEGKSMYDEEVESGGQVADTSLSLHTLLEGDDNNNDEERYSSLDAAVVVRLKENITEAISLLINEIKGSKESIVDQAVNTVYAREIILTYGVSKTILSFLAQAAKFRKFEVFVVESAPSYSGHKMATELAALDIQTTIVPDSSIFAVMKNVSKVIIGVHGVMANGGIIAYAGAYNLAIAAKHYNVPFVVVTGLHKLCPLYAFNQDTINEQHPPSALLSFSSSSLCERVFVENPEFDFVSPELVTLFITNDKSHSPSYIYRLLADHYDQQDYEL